MRRPLSVLLAAALAFVFSPLRSAPALADDPCAGLPTCNANSWGCSSATYPGDDADCATQNADDPTVGLTCMPCAYRLNGNCAAILGCL